MEYITRVAWTVLYIIVTVVVFTGVMNFISISSDIYSPFLYFIIALFIFSLLLSSKKTSIFN
jgi:hypothetical protein